MARPSPYVRPGGDDNPWNIPVNGVLGDHPDVVMLDYPFGVIDPYGLVSGDYARRFYYYAADRADNFNLRFRDYTYPVYYTADADDTYTVQGGGSTINGTEIPWKSTWTAASPTLTSCTAINSDAQVIVIDEATGKCWDMWRVFPNTVAKTLCIQGGSIVGTEVSPTVPGNVTGNIWTKVNGWQPSRGMGQPYIMGLVQPEEISTGRIRHALSLPCRPTSRKFYLPPATKLEHSQTTEIANAIPEGMRFCLTEFGLGPKEDQIAAWIAARHSSKTQAVKDFLEIVATALFEYGWFISDTSGSAGFQFESEKSASVQWNAIGIDPTSTAIQDALDGLMVPPSIDPDYGYIGGNISALTVPFQYEPHQANDIDPESISRVYTQHQGVIS